MLAIAAVHLGAASALGLDVMPACLDVAPANAALNGVADRVTVRLDWYTVQGSSGMNLLDQELVRTGERSVFRGSY